MSNPSAITPRQIQQWLDPYEFSKLRDLPQTEAARKAEDALTQTVRTETLDDTLELLTGAYKRLELIEGNLNTMLTELARAQNQRRFGEKDAEEVYAKLRSLSAGIDQIIDQTTFDKKRILDGAPLILKDNISRSFLEMKFDGFRSSGKDSLNLAFQTQGALAQIFYDQEALDKNAESTLVGLDISEAGYSPPKDGNKELETGKYELEITYNGANSAVTVLDDKGDVVGSKTGIDLSGTGQERVDIGNGLVLSFEKEDRDEAPGENIFDKYPTDLLGPTKLYAKVEYVRLLKHNLDDRDPDEVTSARLFDKEEVTTETGRSLTFVGAAMAGVEEGEEPLGPGDYQLEVDYFGKNSIARLRDADGRLVDMLTGVDLSESNFHDLHFARGPNVTIINESFNEPRGTMKATLTLEARGPDVTREITLEDGLKKRGYGGGEPLEVTRVEGYAPDSENGDNGLGDGDYEVQIDYRGVASTIRLADAATGELLTEKRGVDLTGRETLVDLDNGLRFNVTNRELENTNASLNFNLRVSSEPGPGNDIRRTLELGQGTLEIDEPPRELAFAPPRVSGLKPGAEYYEPGDYRVAIDYFGDLSRVSVFNEEGRRVHTSGTVDLSAEGVTYVDIGGGLEVGVENLGLGREARRLEGTFRYDETEGTATREQDPTAFVVEAEQLVDGNGAITVGAARVNGVPAGNVPLKSGNYTLEVQYYGEYSSVWLKDQEGKPVAVADRLDLTEPGERTINFDNGLEVDINATGYDTFGQTLSSTISYNVPEESPENIDYAQYEKAVRAALEKIREEMASIDETHFEIAQRRDLQASVNPATGGNTQYQADLGTIQLVGAGVDASVLNLLSPQAANAQLDASVSGIMGALKGNALGTQANQPAASVTTLLNNAGRGGGLTSLF